MRTSDFDFELPDAAIARYPAEARDASRLLCLCRETGVVSHHRFVELPELLAPEDLMVVNDSRVLPARLVAQKALTGGKVELLLIERVHEDRRWRAMATHARTLRVGTRLSIGDAHADVLSNEGEGFVVVELSLPAEELTRRHGAMPLPPYLGRAAEEFDRERYQTIFARQDRAGSVAAPTAGLHFTDRVLAQLEARGVRRAALTLDVGPGTFMPVRAEALDDHPMHLERFFLPAETVEAVVAATRIVAVGTTVVRTLESLGELRPGPGQTDLFIRPGFEFRRVQAMLTNFHLPRSTLLMLVCAFAGRDRVLAAYLEAIAEGYRFYSYGDAMLIL